MELNGRSAQERLDGIRATIHSPAERRLFAEYGAVFMTRAIPPPVLIFRDAQEVERFQSGLKTRGALLGQYHIELQAEAMDALTQAAEELSETGGRLTARAADAGRRSYDDTVALWLRNVNRGLDYWLEQGRVDATHADQIRRLAPADQVGPILELEQREQIYFGTYFDKSILYSVAAPGASQHLSMLAFDVMEFQEEEVERTLNRAGWFRTVINDFPHFTYLGINEGDLLYYGLVQTVREYNNRTYSFWVPDQEFFSGDSHQNT